MPPFLIRLKKKLGRLKRNYQSKYREIISFFIDLYYANINAKTLSDDKICIAVTTTKNYANKTIPSLISNLEKIGISKKIVHVFEGGHVANSSTNINGYYHHYIDNNSFDITALIGIIELDLQQEYWLLLHDTISLKKSFKSLFLSIKPAGYDCMPLKPPPAMNMGVYSKSYLLKNKIYLQGFSNKDYSQYSLMKMKKIAFEGEDFLFNTSENKKYIHSSLSKYEYTKNSRYHNAPRLLEGYPQLGLIKYKANFSLQNEWRITL